MGQATGLPVFVVPHFARSEASWQYLEATIASLQRQTDPRWRAVVVDDASPGIDTRSRLARVGAMDVDRVCVVERSQRGGPGAARNSGVEWAAQRGAPFVLFVDADDLAHPQRLQRTRRTLADRPRVDMVYSSFVVIDEVGSPVPGGSLTPSIREILDSHLRPVEGAQAWIPIGVEVGYTTLTSTVSVRTSLAVRHPFPEAHVAEDDHTWFRLLAGGGELAFLPDTATSYRVPSAGRGSASREAEGEGFYWTSALVTADGFSQALATAERRGTITAGQSESLRMRFLARLALTMERENVPALAAALRSMSASSMPDPGGDPPTS